jgi:TatD DNase family protein
MTGPLLPAPRSTLPSLPWTDSHCHLAMEEFAPDREAVVARALEAGVGRFVVVGTNPEDWEAAASWALRPGFRATAGLHPHEASRWDDGCREALSRALARPGVCAVGEIGLDYHYDLSERQAQRAAFEAQVEAAVERGLPVVVHSRESFADTRAILASAGAGLRGVLHCFTYGPDEAEAFLELGLHLSFSGILTFPKAPLLREAALRAPLGRLLVETDAPYLAPVPFRGKRCEPAHAAQVGRFLAQLLNRPEEEVARATSSNAARLFGFEGTSR